MLATQRRGVHRTSRYCILLFLNIFFATGLSALSDDDPFLFGDDEDFAQFDDLIAQDDENRKQPKQGRTVIPAVENILKGLLQGLADAGDQCQEELAKILSTAAGTGGLTTDISRQDLIETVNAVIADPAAKTNLDKVLNCVKQKVVLTQPLWQNTKSPKGRHALYLLPHKVTAREYGDIVFHLFYNQASNMHVSGASLLDFDELLGIVQNDAKAGASLIAAAIRLLPDFSANADAFPRLIGTLLPLFTAIKLQERRAGVFIQGGFERGNWEIQIESALQVAERNFMLNESEIETASGVFKQLFPGGGTGLKTSDFYKINVGLGDTRFKIGRRLIDLDFLCLRAGAEIIVPTSGLDQRPYLEDPQEKTAGLEVFKSAAVTQLRSIRDYLLDAQLGNGAHWGTGAYCQGSVDLCEKKIRLWFRASYDKLFTGDEDRLIMQRPTVRVSDFLTAQFLQDLINNRPTVIAGSKNPVSPYVVLDQFVDQYIFPTPFKVRVKPGSIFNAVFSANFWWKKYRWTLGYDYYSQQRERIDRVYNTTLALTDLLIERAEADENYQHKIFLEMLHQKRFKNFDLAIGLGGDATMVGNNIGKDWTVYAKLALSF